MRTRVKYCGLVRPQDVDAAVAIGADAVGFVFYPKSPRLLDGRTAASLRRRLPSWVMSVGLFVNAPPDEINALAAEVGLDVIQLHGDETIEQARALRLPWWKALRIGARLSTGAGTGQSGAAEGGGGDKADKAGGADEADEADQADQADQAVRRSLVRSLQQYREAEFCLLDSFSGGYGGSGKTFDWSLVPPDAGRRLIMSGGLDAANVGAAIAAVRPFAVDTSSGIQDGNPREKDVGRMEQFMAAVRRADGR